MDAHERPRPPAFHLLLVLFACLAVYWPALNVAGLTFTEGHRVVPAWEMMDRNEWVLPRMFGQIDIRKTPGMQWAVAASSAVFGRTEFAARAVGAASMTALSLLAAFFAARWFGRRAALWAGLATALTPHFWLSGRSAEIEPLNTLAAAAAVLCLLDIMLRERKSLAAELPAAIGAALAISTALLAKGPASLPVVAAAGLAACIVRGSLTPAFRPSLIIALAPPVAAYLGYESAKRSALEHFSASGELPVIESVAVFLWTSKKLAPLGLLKLASMPIVALATAAPATLAMASPWTRTIADRSMPEGALERAQAVSITCLVSLGFLLILGVDNPRYALPSLGFVPILVGFALPALVGAESATARPSLFRRRLLLDRPVFWAAGLFIAAAIVIPVTEARRIRTSGLAAAQKLAAPLPDGAEVWADAIVDARPEVPYYMRTAAAAANRRITLRWVNPLAPVNNMTPVAAPPAPRMPPAGAYLLLRNDTLLNEVAAYEAAGLMPRLEPIETARAHKYDLTLYRVR